MARAGEEGMPTPHPHTWEGGYCGLRGTWSTHSEIKAEARQQHVQCTL